MLIVYIYLKEKKHEKDEPGEGSAEDSDAENNDRNLGDTTDILNMVRYSTKYSTTQLFLCTRRTKHWWR